MKAISYLRVSTQKQGRSNLGIEAQRHAVTTFTKQRGLVIDKEFIEVESASKNDREKLKEAIEMARKHGYKLVIAKLDRLSRNLHFLSGLMEAQIDFVCCDMPEATPLTLKIMAVMAEHERDMISQRTKEALNAAKARGIKLGNIKNLKKGNQMRSKSALEFAHYIFNFTSPLLSNGLSQREIISRLNMMNIKTYSGARWNQVQLQRVLKRVNFKYEKAQY